MYLLCLTFQKSDNLLKRKLLDGAKCSLLFFVGFLLALGSGCANQKNQKRLSYSEGAKQLYKRGRAQLKGSNNQAARKIFQKIKRKYPFSEYATLAELSIADSYFNGTKYLQAIDTYKLFSKLHPTHPQVGYAFYQSALGYYNLRPWQWFLVPANYEKDPSTTLQAINAFREFLKTFPNHKKSKDAKKHLDLCLSQLAKHELLVADFYKKQNKHQAVVWRMQHLLSKYPKIGYDAEAHFKMASAMIKLKQTGSAKIALESILKQHPTSSFAKKATAQLAKLPNSSKIPPSPKKPTTQKAILSTQPTTKPKKL